MGSEITAIVVCDPTSRDVARVEISPDDHRGMLSICCTMGSPLKNSTVLKLQEIAVPEDWTTALHVFCEDPQAANKTYNIQLDNVDRAPQEWIQKVDFEGLCHPEKSTKRALYIGPIPN